MNEYEMPFDKKYKDVAKVLYSIRKLQEEQVIQLQEENNKLQQELDQYKNNIDKAIEYIEKYLHEHVIDEYPDEQSTFYDEKDRFISNAKEVLLNILKGED